MEGRNSHRSSRQVALPNLPFEPQRRSKNFGGVGGLVCPETSRPLPGRRSLPPSNRGGEAQASRSLPRSPGPRRVDSCDPSLPIRCDAIPALRARVAAFSKSNGSSRPTLSVSRRASPSFRPSDTQRVTFTLEPAASCEQDQLGFSGTTSYSACSANRLQWSIHPLLAIDLRPAGSRRHPPGVSRESSERCLGRSLGEIRPFQQILKSCIASDVLASGIHPEPEHGKIVVRECLVNPAKTLVEVAQICVD